MTAESETRGIADKTYNKTGRVIFGAMLIDGVWSATVEPINDALRTDTYFQVILGGNWRRGDSILCPALLDALGDET
jgi:hypothetical protein